MRSRSVLWLTLLVCFLHITKSGYADTGEELLLRGKRATALVEIKPGTLFGSAVCIDSHGLFLMNAHVARNASANDTVTLVLNPNEKSQKIVQATILRLDRELDVALLQAEGTDSYVALPFGNSDALAETAAVRVCGYPSGKDPALAKDAYPGVIVSTSHITSLQKVQDGVRHIEIDTSLSHGALGGPLLNANGKLVGIVEANSESGDLHYILPLHALSSFLHRPDIILQPKSIAYAHRAEPCDFQIRLVSYLPMAQRLTVTLTINEPGQTPRSFVAQQDASDTYTVHAAPMPTHEGISAVKLTVLNGAPALVCEAQNRTIMVGSETVKLSAIRRLEAGPPSVVTLKDGKTLQGSLTGLSAVETRIGTIPAILDLSKQVTFTVEDIETLSGFPSVVVTVKQGEQIVAEQSGLLPLEDAPAAPRQGTLLVCADECPTEIAELPGGKRNALVDVKRYIQNVANLFTGGRRGHFLIYSDHEAFGETFRDALQEAGHTVEHNLHPRSLDSYDAVFTGGTVAVNRDALVPYIQHGGKVYLAGGCGAEAPYWANLLRSFGMAYKPDTDADPPGHDALAVTDFGSDALFAGVHTLYVSGISPIQVLEGNANAARTRILVSRNSNNLWALYVGEPLPPQ